MARAAEYRQPADIADRNEPLRPVLRIWKGLIGHRLVSDQSSSRIKSAKGVLCIGQRLRRDVYTRILIRDGRPVSDLNTKRLDHPRKLIEGVAAFESGWWIASRRFIVAQPDLDQT